MTEPRQWDTATHRLIMGPSGTVTPKQISANFYAELDQEFGNFAGHSLVAVHHFEEAWPTWEMHPEGDEIVYLISGEIDFVLMLDGREKILHVDEPGAAIVVPRGIWHTARPRQKTSMLFITPGEGTLNAEQPDI
jgi:mannose-6-phosphate isomerase-like protein (cupin superfamily)